jgi:multiple sugar transport system ATP-binding protein
MGRAIVRSPQVFLFDEPLSNLDAKLRGQMRVEIKQAASRRSASRSIYVTHDQIEAMTLGQRIVVMNEGRIQQIDTPMRLYERPVNTFVATFLGSPKMNLLWGTLLDGDAGLRLRIADGVEMALTPPPSLRPKLQGYVGREITVGLRPENLHLSRDDEDGALPARVEAVEPVGNEAFLNLGCGGRELVVRLPPYDLPKAGEQVRLGYDGARLHYFDRDSELRLEEETQ